MCIYTPHHPVRTYCTALPASLLERNARVASARSRQSKETKPSRTEANAAADAVIAAAAAQDGLGSSSGGGDGTGEANGGKDNGARGGEVAVPPPRVPGTLPPRASYISFLCGGRLMQQTGSMMGMNLSLWAGAWAWASHKGLI